MGNRGLKSLALLIILNKTISAASNIKFYNSPNFVGLFYEAEPKAECTDVPAYANNRAVSIKTDDCILVYKNFSCVAEYIKITKSGRDAIGGNLKNFDWAGPFDLVASSFRLCSETEGGDIVNVDIFENIFSQISKLDAVTQLMLIKLTFADPTLINRSHVPVLTAEYKNVCGCISLPKDVKQVLSVHNHGNCVRTFFTEDCTGHSAELRAGKSPASERWRDWGASGQPVWGNMRSFEPCDSPDTACLNLTASIFKFEIAPKFDLENVGTVELSEKTTFRNNGRATLTKEYSVKNTIKEVYQVQESTTTTTIKTVNTETSATFSISNSAEVEVSATVAGVGVKAKNTLTLSASTTLKNAYSTTRQNSQQNTFTYTTESSKEFVMSQKVEVQPCTEYEINSYVKVLKDIDIDYTVYSKLSGFYGEERMTADQLRSKIKGMTYDRDFDRWTIVVKTRGVMKATFGVEAVMNGTGKLIKSCLSELNLEKASEITTQAILNASTAVHTTYTSAEPMKAPETDVTSKGPDTDVTSKGPDLDAPVKELDKNPTTWTNLAASIAENIYVLVGVGVTVWLVIMGCLIYIICYRSDRYQKPNLYDANQCSGDGKQTVYYFKEETKNALK